MQTRHVGGCKRIYRRYDPSCARCLELMTGSPARPGWVYKTPTLFHDQLPGIYCFCTDTPLTALRCKRCGKPPYTD